MYVDFFVLTRATALVSNCGGESTFVGSAKVLREAHGLKSYRAVDCIELAPWPAHTHVDWKGSAGWELLAHTAPGLIFAIGVGLVLLAVAGILLCCCTGTSVSTVSHKLLGLLAAGLSYGRVGDYGCVARAEPRAL